MASLAALSACASAVGYAAGEPLKTFRAQGNEPGWRLDIEGSQMTLFLDLLQNVRRFDLSPDGALILETDDRRTLTARRSG